MQLLDDIRDLVRSIIKGLAKILNGLTGGSLSPNAVTMIGLLAHLPIALLIATRHNLKAAVLLVIFGLFDTLDGELARLQHRANAAGMLLDATTDRFKEVMLYTGAAYAIIAAQDRPLMAVWAVLACGASLCVSYVKAKGETAIKDRNYSVSQINKLFANGLMRFEVRMAILILGLLSNRIILATVIIAIFSSITAVNRLISISAKLKDD